MNCNIVSVRGCERCGGVMIPICREIKRDDGSSFIVVMWICNKCGNMRGAYIGAV